MNGTQWKTALLAALATLGSVLSRALGGWDGVLGVLVALMGVDYITGVLLAAVWHRSAKSETGALSSGSGFQGLCRKAVILMVVWLAEMVDEATGAGCFRTACALFFIGNEGISVLENVGLMGVPYPAFLRRALEELQTKGENTQC